MKRLALGISAGVLLLATVGSAAWSKDAEPMDRATPNKGELMRDCIRKHQAGDVNLSKSELKRLCKAEVEQHLQSGGPPPPQDSPKP